MSVAELSVSFVETKLKEREAGLKNNKHLPSPLLVFVSGPQGSGKSYNSEILRRSLKEKGVKVALVSIDDFYLTHEDQLALQKKFPENRLLHGRGLPGTHDLTALRDVLESLRQKDGGSVSLPVYDKSKFDGQGDRSGMVDVQLPLECIIIEGWFLGFQPLDTDALKNRYEAGSSTLKAHGIQDLVQVNESLSEYGRLLWNSGCFDTIGIKFATDDVKNVYTWRLQQEHSLIKERGQGMDDKQVEAFVDRYMPCYEPVSYTHLDVYKRQDISCFK